MVDHRDHTEVQEFETRLTEVGQESASSSIRHTDVTVDKLDKTEKKKSKLDIIHEKTLSESNSRSAAQGYQTVLGLPLKDQVLNL